MVELSEPAEEILESLWVMTVEGDNPSCSFSSLNITANSAQLAELVQLHFVKVCNGQVRLCMKGRTEAQMAVRRHRLAEHLTMGILGMPGDEGNDQACIFEHRLGHGGDTKLCTLLNHPTTCPHGNPIPPGDCCRAARQKGKPCIFPLPKLKPGEQGEIAYLATSDDKKMQKLMSMGVLPGSQLVLVQNFPSYIFKIGQSQFAVDEELAQEIYVRRVPK